MHVVIYILQSNSAVVYLDLTDYCYGFVEVVRNYPPLNNKSHLHGLFILKIWEEISTDYILCVEVFTPILKCLQLI